MFEGLGAAEGLLASGTENKTNCPPQLLHSVAVSTETSNPYQVSSLAQPVHKKGARLLFSYEIGKPAILATMTSTEVNVRSAASM